MVYGEQFGGFILLGKVIIDRYVGMYDFDDSVNP